MTEWGYGRAPAWRRRDKIGVAVVSAVLVALFVAMAPFAIQTTRDLVQALRPCVMLAPERFDRQMWDSRTPCNGRASMVDDIQNNVLKTGMTRPEVVVLLGEPDADDRGVPSGRAIAYEMDCWIDCDWLVVQFDDVWQLTGTYQYQD